MIVNVMAPYRLNLHRLIAAGIPELKLHTLVTHGPAEEPIRTYPITVRDGRLWLSGVASA